MTIALHQLAFEALMLDWACNAEVQLVQKDDLGDYDPANFIGKYVHEPGWHLWMSGTDHDAGYSTLMQVWCAIMHLCMACSPLLPSWRVLFPSWCDPGPQMIREFENGPTPWWWGSKALGDELGDLKVWNGASCIKSAYFAHLADFIEAVRCSALCVNGRSIKQSPVSISC